MNDFWTYVDLIIIYTPTLNVARLIYRCFTIAFLKTLNKKVFNLRNPIMRFSPDLLNVESEVDQNDMTYDGSRFLHIDITTDPYFLV